MEFPVVTLATIVYCECSIFPVAFMSVGCPLYKSKIAPQNNRKPCAFYKAAHSLQSSSYRVCEVKVLRDL